MEGRPWGGGKDALPFMPSARRRPRAFTLVELLVVIAIIGILIGLLLPAVQYSRETARRAACRNNLKNVAMGLHSFHDAKRRLPAGCMGTRNLDHAWCSYILPYMEQTSIYRQIDFRRPWNDPDGNYAATRALIPLLHCPSSILQDPAKSDYAGITGSVIVGAPRGVSMLSGVLIHVEGSQQGVRFSDILDGLSNTIMVAESADRPEEDHGNWADGLATFFCNGLINAAHGEIASHHRGGATVAMADGSANFFVTDMSIEVVQALCTRNGKEPMTNVDL
jgi:prepilin-type N-terminal cleavage/methylation domain-containing protein